MNTYSEDKMYENYSSEVERMQKCIDELQQENKKLNGVIQTYDILLKSNVEENKQLKNNWNELKKWLRIKDILANSKINPQSIKFKDLLKHMEYLEKER